MSMMAVTFSRQSQLKAGSDQLWYSYLDTDYAFLVDLSNIPCSEAFVFYFLTCDGRIET